MVGIRKRALTAKLDVEVVKLRMAVFNRELFAKVPAEPGAEKIVELS